MKKEYQAPEIYVISTDTVNCLMECSWKVYDGENITPKVIDDTPDEVGAKGGGFWDDTDW